jgi:hypothetical protein
LFYLLESALHWQEVETEVDAPSSPEATTMVAPMAASFRACVLKAVITVEDTV